MEVGKGKAKVVVMEDEEDEVGPSSHGKKRAHSPAGDSEASKQPCLDTEDLQGANLDDLAGILAGVPAPFVPSDPKAGPSGTRGMEEAELGDEDAEGDEEVKEQVEEVREEAEEEEVAEEGEEEVRLLSRCWMTLTSWCSQLAMAQEMSSSNEDHEQEEHPAPVTRWDTRWTPLPLSHVTGGDFNWLGEELVYPVTSMRLPEELQ